MAKVVCNKLKHRVPMGLSRRDVVLPLALPEGGEQLPCCVQEGGLTVAGCTNAALRVAPPLVGVWEALRVGRLSSAGLPTAGRFPKEGLVSEKKTSF